MKVPEALAVLALLGTMVGCGKSSNGGVTDAATDASDAGDVDDASLLSCHNMTAAQACGTLQTYTCELTWPAAQTDTALCVPNSGGFGYFESDCGGYHLLGESGADFGIGFYYS